MILSVSIYLICILSLLYKKVFNMMLKYIVQAILCLVLFTYLIDKAKLIVS